MPLYEYECPKWRRREEVRVGSMTAPMVDVRCPACGEAMQRVPSAAAVPPSGTYSYGGGR